MAFLFPRRSRQGAALRQIGDIVGRRRADRFLGFLARQGIDAQLREDEGDRFSVWVIDEDQLEAADGHYRAFKAAPDAAVFDAPAAKASGKDRGRAGRGRYIDVRTEIFNRGRARTMPVTMALIGLSVVLTLLMSVPGARGLIDLLYYSEYAGTTFPEIANGQVWRLVTPVFLHGGVLHLLFNMLWLYQLGGAIEINEGSVYTTALILVTAALVDTAQYLMAGAGFLGMSGVVYALFGYVWMMARYQPATRYVLARETVIVMLVWLGVCLVGLIPGVANTEHVAGLIVGVVWGFLRSGFLGTMSRRRKWRDGR